MKAPPPEIKGWTSQVLAPIVGTIGFLYELIATRLDRPNVLVACLVLIGIRFADRWDRERRDHMEDS